MVSLRQPRVHLPRCDSVLIVASWNSGRDVAHASTLEFLTSQTSSANFEWIFGVEHEAASDTTTSRRRSMRVNPS